jgi:hypothetical protein
MRQCMTRVLACPGCGPTHEEESVMAESGVVTVWQCDAIMLLVVVIVNGGRSSVLQVRVWVPTGLNLDLDLNIYTYGCKTGFIPALIGSGWVRVDT